MSNMKKLLSWAEDRGLNCAADEARKLRRRERATLAMNRAALNHEHDCDMQRKERNIEP